MNLRTTILLVSVTLITLTAIVGVMATFPDLFARKPKPASSVSATPATDRGPTQAPAVDSTAKAAPAMAPPINPLLSQIEMVCAKLLTGGQATFDLAQLKRDLLAANAREAITAIVAFLKSGHDAGTGQEFGVGGQGQLDQAPTLRVFLLDLLGTIARRTGNADAGGLMRTILENKSSADEWAIALRNVAWQEPAATGYLSAKLQEMLAYQPWRQAPSAGMLEALDVAVFTHNPALIPPLADALRGDQISLQRAAAIALDRLAERAPLEVMNYLNANPGTMADRPFVRADYFAKADVAQPAQRRAVEIYLERSDVGLAEKVKLLEALPMPASFVSDSLLAQPPPEPDDDARRAALASATNDWLAKSRFPELSRQIAELRNRVTTR